MDGIDTHQLAFVLWSVGVSNRRKYITSSGSSAPETKQDIRDSGQL